MPTPNPSPRIAILFDFDGTITQPLLDFDRIRADIGIAAGPILEALALMDEPARLRAERILEDHERLASENAVLQPGAAETIAALRAAGHGVGIITRNARRWVTPVLDRFGITVDFLRTRECGTTKPSPAPVLAACEALHAAPAASWMIGDHLMDLLSGRSAGTRTILMIGGHAPNAPPPESWLPHADHVITRLEEVVEIVGGG
jgi:HAD superfamily hydrolase (TIGR01509 family)